MLTLTNFLRALPGVKPIKARALALDGDLLTPGERADIRAGDDLWATLEVGPDAGAALLAAYRSGRLPMQRGAVPGDAPRIDAYLAGSDRLREAIAERERRRRILREPGLIRESDFADDVLLDAVFHAQLGAGAGTLTLAGIAVTKDLAGFRSNSGRSTGWAVTFSWTGSDGVARTSGRTPPEASNRRNDAERNWGLGPG